MFQFRYVFTTVQKRSANLWEIFSKGELIFLQFIEIFTFLRLCLHKKKVVKSHDFRFIMQLHGNFDYIVTKTFCILTSVQCTYIPANTLLLYSQRGFDLITTCPIAPNFKRWSNEKKICLGQS